MVAEKEQMANDYQGLEAEMGKAVRDTAGTNRQLSNKLREALGQLQQNEISNRMKLTADYLRRGLIWLLVGGAITVAFISDHQKHSLWHLLAVRILLRGRRACETRL